MSMKTSPFKTPPGFFEGQQRAIWEQAKGEGNRAERIAAGTPSWVGWTAGIAAVLFVAFLVSPGTGDANCETFACLWDATPTEQLEIDDREIDLWMEDDFLFESLLNDDTDV